MIDTVNGFDNVLYEISNENHPPSTQWQYHMIRFIKDYERTKPQQHPVGMTFQYKGGSNQTLFDSPADWVSPNPDGGYRDDPPPADGRKVVLSDTDHLWGIGGNLAWVWKSFTRGYNPIFMDPYDGDILGNRFDPKWDPIRRSMGYTLRYARRMDLAQMRPAGEAASTKYCLANPGRQYLVYKPGAGDSVTVKLEAGDVHLRMVRSGGRPAGRDRDKDRGRRRDPVSVSHQGRRRALAHTDGLSRRGLAADNARIPGTGFDPAQRGRGLSP